MNVRLLVDGIARQPAKFRSFARSLLASATLLLVIVSGCGKETGGGGSSDTNWLEACDSDADCRGFSCLCGVCTRECKAARDCADLDDSTTCTMQPALVSACMVTGLCIRTASLPDGSFGSSGSSGSSGSGGSGGSAGRGAGGRGNGGVSDRNDGGASTGGRGGSGGARTGGRDGGGTAGMSSGGHDAGSGNKDGGEVGDSGPDASMEPDGRAPDAICGQFTFCKCGSAAYCDQAGCVTAPSAQCPPPDSLVPGCVPYCQPGFVCVRHQQIGGAVFEPDAGICPDSRVFVPEAPGTCSLAPSFTCEPIPATCSEALRDAAAEPDCDCARSLCPSGTACSTSAHRQIDCIARVP